MKIATYNVNGVNGRLLVLLRWLEQALPDVVCLQELKAPQEKFPEAAIRDAGYGAIWHGQKSWNGVAILARGVEPHETRRGLPGDPDDGHSRYIEAAVRGVLIGCLYLPNGNPAPGPKFDYKLRWFERLAAHAAELLAIGAPVVLAGDYNVMPTDLDVYKPERWRDDALFRPEVREAYARLIAQGWTDALRELHPGERIYTFWDYFRNAYGRDAGLRIDHLLLSPSVARRLKTAEVDRQVRGWEKASDHAPTWILLADETKRSKVGPKAMAPVAASTLVQPAKTSDVAPARPIGNIYCGTCSWTDRTLIESGGFYAADIRSPEARLRYYAQAFPIVEVDATYYALPSEQNARLWAERTPPGFVFNIKAFGLLTQHPIDPRRLPEVVRERLPGKVLEGGRLYHNGVPAEVRELVWTMHIEALRPLAEAGKLGCMLFQFPHWFRKNRASVDYLREVRERLPWPVAVEFRGGGWMEAERQSRTLKLLEDLGLAYVSVDEPQGFPSSTPPVVACTSELAVLRLHGHNAETWEKPNITAAERFRYLYSADELRRWVGPVLALAEQAERVHVLMNNCYRDYAVRNARQLARLLTQSRPDSGPVTPPAVSQ